MNDKMCVACVCAWVGGCEKVKGHTVCQVWGCTMKEEVDDLFILSKSLSVIRRLRHLELAPALCVRLCVSREIVAYVTPAGQCVFVRASHWEWVQNQSRWWWWWGVGGVKYTILLYSKLNLSFMYIENSYLLKLVSDSKDLCLTKNQKYFSTSV